MLNEFEKRGIKVAATVPLPPSVQLMLDEKLNPILVCLDGVKTDKVDVSKWYAVRWMVEGKSKVP
jgi:hypothetical protein